MRLQFTGLALGLAVLAAGCSHLNAVDFVRAENSGVAGEHLLLLGVRNGKPDDLPSKRADLLQDVELMSALDKSCQAQAEGSDQIKMAITPIAPILAALSQVAVGLYFDRQKQRIEDIVAAAQATYSVTTEMAPLQVAGADCLLVLRYTERDGQLQRVGLQLLLRVRRIEGRFPQEAAVVFVRPVFVRARNAVAVTRKSEHPSISVAAAISLKALGRRQGDDFLQVLPVSEVVVSVADVQLGEATLCTDLSCQRSGWLAFPVDRGFLSVSVAIAEQGQTGFNDKLVLAEIAALKEALGPAVAEVVKAKVGD